MKPSQKRIAINHHAELAATNLEDENQALTKAMTLFPDMRHLDIEAWRTTFRNNQKIEIESRQMSLILKLTGRKLARPH